MNTLFIASEVFAPFFGVSTLNNKVKLNIIKSVFHNAYVEFINLIGGIK